jgi:hypothetical protein
MVVAASSTWHYFILDVLTVEAYVCGDGDKLIIHMNISQVIMESDLLELVSLWKTRNNHRDSTLHVLKQIHELVGGCKYFDILHVNREVNLSPHNIAKFASSSDSNCTYIYPRCWNTSSCTE